MEVMIRKHHDTRRFDAEKHLKDSIKRWQITFDGIKDSIFLLDCNGIIIQANKSASKLLNKTEAEILGHNCFEVVHSSSDNIEDCPFIRMKQSKKRERMLLPVGEKWFEVIVDPILDDNGYLSSVVHFISDITEWKKMEDSLKKSEEKFRQTFVMSPDSININRLADGMYVSINEGFTKLTGYFSEETIGKTSEELNIWVDPDDRDKLIKGLKDCGKVENLEAGFRMKDGSVKFGLMSATIIDLDGDPHILNITRDNTERKQAEIAVKKKVEELEWMNKMMIDRELKMIELKKEINILLNKLGENDKYVIHEKGK
jgi:two-component system cell cycle sensor histidine kinase/response regulator CckA